MRRTLSFLALSLLITATADASVVGPSPVPGVTRPAVLIGNNWEGTTDIVDPETFERLDRINVIPDREVRQQEIFFRPDKGAFFLAVRALIGEGHDQFNDDVFSSNDGRTIYVSRPSFADVVAIDLATKKIVWRAPVDGYRSDHMAINRAGTRLLVSASTGNVVHELDTATGNRVGVYESGDSPHESVYSRDESTIFHASIGRVYSPVDDPKEASDAVAGGEFFQVMDAKSHKVLKRIDMGQKMAEAGYPGYSSAVRPMALSPDEKFVYFQLSFFFGFVEYDLVNDKVTRVAMLPIPEKTKQIPKVQYVLNSAHHGLALDPSGKRFCVAGTMSDYGAIVDRSTFAVHLLPKDISKPYWSTNSADGKYCYISASGANEVVVVSYETGDEVTRFPVGYHPQRVRNGVVTVAQYPQGKHGEPFKLIAARRVTVKSAQTAVRCGLAGAVRLDLVRCRVRLTRGGKLIGVGERAVPKGAKTINVRVALTAAGRRALKAHPKGIKAALAVRGVDSVGRVARISRTIQVRAAR